MATTEVLLACHMSESESEKETDERIVLVHIPHSQILSQCMTIRSRYQRIVPGYRLQRIVSWSLNSPISEGSNQEGTTLVRARMM